MQKNLLPDYTTHSYIAMGGLGTTASPKL